MLPDFEMIIREFPEKEDIVIYPISDVHLGARECMEQEFISFIGTIAEQPNAYVILGGDLIDNGTRNSVTNIFRATMPPSSQKKEMAKILEPIRDKLLCAVSGNHERRKDNRSADDDPMYDILAKIDCEHIHRENIAFLKLRFGNADGDGMRNPTYTLVVCHGAGGGQLTSGAVLRGERFAYSISGADALIFGHTHRPFTTTPGQIVIDPRNNRVSIKPFKVINMTSWLDYTDYAAQKMLTPTAHCMQTLTLRGNRKEMIVTM